MGNDQYAWAPFSAGVHKCSGYPLAMLEIPVVLAIMLRDFNLDIMDDLPGYDWKSAFGVIGMSVRALSCSIGFAC